MPFELKDVILVLQLLAVPLIIIGAIVIPRIKTFYINKSIYTGRNFAKSKTAYDYSRQAAEILGVDHSIIENKAYTKELYDVLIQARLMGYNLDKYALNKKYSLGALKGLLEFYTLGYDEEYIKAKLGKDLHKLFEKYSSDVMREVRFALMDSFSKEQILKMLQTNGSYCWKASCVKEIRLAFKHGLTMDQINIFALRPEEGTYPIRAMREIRLGLEDGIDVLAYTWRPNNTHISIIKGEYDEKYAIGSTATEANFMKQMRYALISKKSSKSVAADVDDLIAKINSYKNAASYKKGKYGIDFPNLELALVTLTRRGIEAGIDIIEDWWNLSSFMPDADRYEISKQNWGKGGRRGYLDEHDEEAALDAFTLNFNAKIKALRPSAKKKINSTDISKFKVNNSKQKFVVIEED